MQVLNFADDTLLYFKFNKTKEVEKTINTELDNLYKWLNVNHLKLNISKTKYMVFTPNSSKFKALSNLKIVLGNNTAIVIQQLFYFCTKYS